MHRVAARALVALSLLTLGACAARTPGTLARPEAFPRSPAPRPAPAASQNEGDVALESAAPRVATVPAAAAVLQTAFDLLGTKYRFGGTSPETGFDCSGFVGYVLRQHGVELPRTVVEQFAAGRAVAQDEIQAGDLVFFSTTGPGATHVGLVVTTASRWEFIHAPADGANVRVERFDTGYWQQRWVGARRVQ